jgi:hypothetical protein
MDAKIKSTIWEDDEFSALDAQGKVIFFWLITCQGTNNIGYYEVNGRYRVWVRHFIRHQWPPGSLEPSSNVFKNLRSHFMALPESFKSAFEGSYKGLVILFNGLPVAEGASKGLTRGGKGQEQNRTEQNSTDPNRYQRKGCGEGEGYLEWPKLDEWLKAAEIEGLTEQQARLEWAYQERKVPAERWRGIDPERLRHHAAFVLGQHRLRKNKKTAAPGESGGAPVDEGEMKDLVKA